MSSPDPRQQLLNWWARKIEPRHIWATVGPWGRPLPPTHTVGDQAWAIDEADLLRLNEAFTRVAGKLRRRFSVVLSEEPAEEEASSWYVQYEPCADHVFALSTRERRSCLCTHYERWKVLRPEFLAVQARIDVHLQENRIVDALLTCFDEEEVVSRLLDAHPELPA